MGVDPAQALAGRLLGHPVVRNLGGQPLLDRALLRCTCGEDGCDSVRADILVDDDVVTWQHFRAGASPWTSARSTSTGDSTTRPCSGPSSSRLRDRPADFNVRSPRECRALQAMSCSKGGKHIPDLSLATTPGTTYAVEWVDVPDRQAATVSVRKQFTDDQITRSRKLEGQWWGDGGAYFVASFARASDGSANEHDGQVWFYDPAAQTVTLKTIFGVNPDPTVDAGNYDGPDNMTLSPHGGLILAEDGEGINHLVGVTEDGETYPMARNDMNDSEFTGPVFSADGKVLFANIQSPGHVFAITGPWGRYGAGSSAR